MRPDRILLSLLLLAFGGVAVAQEQAFTRRSTELRERPSSEGKSLATLPEETPLKVLSRSGGWTEVEANTRKGWVYVFHVRFPATVETTKTSSGSSALGSLGSFFGGGQRKTENAKIATIGIRGLSEEELKNASPSPEALRKLYSFRADKGNAERFAREAKLAPQNVPYEGGK